MSTLALHSSFSPTRARHAFADATRKKPKLGRLASANATFSGSTTKKAMHKIRLEKRFSSPPETIDTTRGESGTRGGTSIAVVSERQNSPMLRTKLHCYQPAEVAEELCLMDAGLLRKIRPEELERGAWMKKDKELMAPNVLAMVHTSNDLAMLVPTEILAETTPQAMAKVIVSFIKIANYCHGRLNFNSLKAILAGLQCTPIYRLKKTWKEVPAKYKKKFEGLCQLMSEEMNYRKYRHALEDVLRTNSPCVPFLGVLLTTIVQFSSHTLSNRKCSGIEDYTVMEAVTVRNRLEKLRRRSSIRYPQVHRLSSISGLPKDDKREAPQMKATPLDVCILEDSESEVCASILDEDWAPKVTSYFTFRNEKISTNDVCPIRENESEREDSEKKFRRRSNCITMPYFPERCEDCTKPPCDGEAPNEADKADDSDIPISLSDISLRDNNDKQQLWENRWEDASKSDDIARQESYKDVLEHYKTLDDDCSMEYGRFCRSVPVRRRRRNGTSENVFLGRQESMSSALDQIHGSVGDSEGRINSPTSISSSGSSSSSLYHTEVSTMAFTDSSRACSPKMPRMNRCASDQQMSTPLAIPPSIHNSISMECIRDVMKIDPFEDDDQESETPGTGPRLRTTSSFNLSDEGISVGEPEEAELSSYSPDLITPPPVTIDLKVSHLQDVSTPTLAPPKSLPAMTAADRHSWDPSKHTLLSELTKFYLKQEKAIKKKSSGSVQEDEEEEPAVAPTRRRSRARGSKVLGIALASSMPVKDWALILSRYQMLSLGCSNGLSSQEQLRSLILNYPRNPDALNYKLSHQREPSNL